MLPGLALAIPICCAALRAKSKDLAARRIGSQVVAVALAAPAAPPSRLGAARHSSQSQAAAELEAGGTEPAKPAPPRMAASQPAGPASSEKGEGTDPEILRIEQDLDRLNHDPAARHAFYHQIDEMVSSVRSGRLIPPKLMLEGASPDRTASTHMPLASFTSSAAPLAEADPDRFDPPFQSPAASGRFHPRAHTLPLAAAPVIRASSTVARGEEPHFPTTIPPIQRPTGNGSLDAHVVSRLLYWAKQNHCPAELALATAWQESRLSLYPADGSSGEIGVMQILPARAKAEGVNPRSLRNPDVNMWLGTKLLAAYYQQEGSLRRAAMQYVAGPNVFNHRYPASVRDYIAGYSASVRNYAGYFKQYVDF